MVCGIVGSGKSIYCEKIRLQYNAVKLSVDEIYRCIIKKDRKAFYQTRRLISRNLFQLTSEDFKIRLPSIIPERKLYNKKVRARYMEPTKTFIINTSK